MTGYDTLYHWNVNNYGWCRNMTGFDPKNPYAFKAVLIHAVLHAVLSLSMASLSYFMFHSFWLHTLYVMALFSVAAKNGATRYFKMMTRYYEKAIENHIKSHKEKKVE